MTVEELHALHPNGLTDAYIDRVQVNYHDRSVEFSLRLRRNLPDTPNAGEYQAATLILREFYYFVVDQPDVNRLRHPGSSIRVDGDAEDRRRFSPLAELKSQPSPTAFCCRFYVHDWNSFIHVAAEMAELS